MDLIHDICLTQPYISEYWDLHYTVYFDKSIFQQNTIQYRAWTSVDMTLFKLDIVKFALYYSTTERVTELVLIYNNVLFDISGKHFPLNENYITYIIELPCLKNIILFKFVFP